MPQSDKSRSQTLNSNQLQEDDSAIHDWYRFVLSFPPHLVCQYLEDFGAKPTATILDPFCGTGTTVVEAKKQGYASVGLEANPMAYFASQVKTNWAINPTAFEQHGREIVEEAYTVFTKQRLNGYHDLPLFVSQSASSKNLKTLTPDQEGLILRDSIGDLPLHRVLEVLQLIRAARMPWTPHQELALATTLVQDASNLKFGPEVGVRRDKRQDADVPGLWYRKIEQMAEDLRAFDSQKHVPAKIYNHDTRDSLGEVSDIDIVITSPPYPNEKDYTRATRLESVVLGFIQNRDDLRRIKKQLIRSNTRNVYVDDTDDQWVDRFSSIQQLASEIEAKRQELGKTSGFERMYHRVVRLYFGGMLRHFEMMKHLLRPGALCAYVVGDQESFLRVPIRTGQLLAEIAEYAGYKVERIDLWRTRLATATGNQIREEVVILQWPGA